MKHLILAIISLLVTPSLFANSWIDPNWEEMIRDASVIGLFEITEGGLDEAKLSPLKILKGKQTNDIKIRRFDNNCWTEGFQHERALRKGQRTYLFLHGERNTLRTPTPTTGIMTLNTNGTVNGSLFSPSWPWEQPPLPAEDFECFITNTVCFQESGVPNMDFTHPLRLRISNCLTSNETNCISGKLILYRLWGGRDWIDNFESITNYPLPEARYQAALLLGDMQPDQQAEKLLTIMLSDTNTFVQGQAVTQLMKSADKEKVLALLTRKLPSAASGVSDPSNIMDPVMNTYYGGQMAIIEQIGKHKYTAAENELLSIAKHTQNPGILHAAYRTLVEFGSTDLSGIIALQLRSDNPHLVGEAIRLSRKLPKPVEENVRRALEHVLTTSDIDSYEASIIFDSLTSESLHALLPWFNSMMIFDPPKREAENYLGNAIALTKASSSVDAHEMVDRILYYWTGIDSRAISSPSLLKKKMELERHYNNRVLQNQVINKKKYSTTASSIVFIDFAKAADSPGKDIPKHDYHIDLEMTVPTNDPNNPFDEITASYDDHSKISPLLKWRREIAKNADIPVSSLGIFCHPSSGRGGHTNNTDERIESRQEIVNAYVNYAKRTKSVKATRLINLVIETGLAKHMECEDLFLRIHD